MRALFPRWSDTVFRICLGLGAIGFVSIPSAAMLWVRTPYVTRQYDPVDQPIAFDHRHHVRDDGIDCLYCHYEAAYAKQAGVPSTSLCMNCHSQVWQQAARLAPVRSSLLEDRPIRWRRVHQLAEFVYFDHSAHVSHGVGCVECHGRVDLMARVYPVSPLTMQWCTDCHRDPAPYLRPQSEITNMQWEPGRARRALGEEIQAALHIAPPVNCSGCHR